MYDRFRALHPKTKPQMRWAIQVSFPKGFDTRCIHHFMNTNEKIICFSSALGNIPSWCPSCKGHLITTTTQTHAMLRVSYSKLVLGIPFSFLGTLWYFTILFAIFVLKNLELTEGFMVKYSSYIPVTATILTQTYRLWTTSPTAAVTAYGMQRRRRRGIRPSWSMIRRSRS